MTAGPDEPRGEDAIPCPCSCNPYCGCACHDGGLPRCREALAILVELLDHRGIRLPKDHACAECVPGGPMIVAGFRCAMHEARAALAGVPPQNDQPHESLASSPPAPPADADATGEVK